MILSKKLKTSKKNYFVCLVHKALTMPNIKVAHEVIIVLNSILIQDIKLYPKADNNPMNLIKKFFKDKDINLLSSLD